MRTRSHFIIALSVCAIAVALSGCDWAQFRYGPEHLGVSLDGSISAATVGSLQLAWTAQPSDAFHRFEGSPAVAGGAVYIADDEAALAFDALGVQQCSGQPKTCQPIKSQNEVMGGRITSPAVAGDLVYFGSDVGDLYAWEPGCVSGCGYNWLGSVQSDRVVAPPTVASGVVYASSDAKLFAFDAIESPTRCNTELDICPPLWSAALDNQPGPAAVAGGVLYVGTRSNTVYAFDATGTQHCSGSPKTCTPLWKANAGGAISGSPAVINGMVYVPTQAGEVSVYDAAGHTGCFGTPTVCTPLFTMTGGGAFSGSAAIANGFLYVGSSDGTIYGFDANGSNHCTGVPKTCTPVWTASTGGAVSSSPAVANGVLYIGSDDTKVYAFDATGAVNCTGTAVKSCAQLWSATTGGTVRSSPVVANRFVYIVAGDGALYAYSLP